MFESWGWSEVLLGVDVDEAMDDAIEHDCFGSGTPLLEGFPPEFLQHGCDAV